LTKRKIVLGSRGSKLALWQASHVRDLLAERAPEYEYDIRVIHTKGDKILDVALSKIGDKGLFTKELERELMRGGVDLCVHSMKDMPTQLPDGLAILGVPERAVPFDALVGPAGIALEGLPAGARVATGSLRRVAQLKRLRPDIQTCEMRGNIDTRIGRVMAGEFDAAILAAAGLHRLGLHENIAQILPAATMIPAVGQGAIAVEAREGDDEVRRLCAAITDDSTLRCVSAERYVLRELEGGCQVPMGAHAGIAGEGDRAVFAMTAFVSSLDGSRFLQAAGQGACDGWLDVARRITDDLVAQGAEEILEELR
jgi:hydroxymethylbilane synthase